MTGLPEKLKVPTHQRCEMIDLTRQLRQRLAETGLEHGCVTVFVPHTTAGVTINEHADPDVAADMLAFLSDLVPERRNWRHSEGNSDAHIKASLMGSSARVMVAGGQLCLGTWQGVFFCEFDGPRSREVWVSFEETRALQ